MDFAEYKDILVVLELDEGKPVNVSLENIAAAKSVVNGGKVIAVTVCENAAKTAIEYGADSAIVIEGAQFEGYNADAVADAVAQIAAEVKPAAIFTGATGKGKDLVPRIAAKLATGSVCDATAVKLDEAGNVVFTVPAYGGNILTDVVIDSVRPQVASIRGGSVAKLEPEAGKAGDIAKKAITVADDQIKLQIKETVKEIAESVNLEEAEVIDCRWPWYGQQRKHSTNYRNWQISLVVLLVVQDLLWNLVGLAVHIRLASQVSRSTKGILCIWYFRCYTACIRYDRFRLYCCCQQR